MIRHDVDAGARVSDVEYATWHAYDVGGPRLHLKVRYVEGEEIVDWRHGPDLFAALDLAEAQGWRSFDREPGSAPGEYAIIYMRRERPTNRPS